MKKPSARLKIKKLSHVKIKDGKCTLPPLEHKNHPGRLVLFAVAVIAAGLAIGYTWGPKELLIGVISTALAYAGLCYLYYL